MHLTQGTGTQRQGSGDLSFNRDKNKVLPCNCNKTDLYISAGAKKMKRNVPS